MMLTSGALFHRLSAAPAARSVSALLAWGSCWVGVALSPQAWNMRTMVVNREHNRRHTIRDGLNSNVSEARLCGWTNSVTMLTKKREHQLSNIMLNQTVDGRMCDLLFAHIIRMTDINMPNAIFQRSEDLRVLFRDIRTPSTIPRLVPCYSTHYTSLEGSSHNRIHISIAPLDD
jgi:hypothetical protein